MARSVLLDPAQSRSFMLVDLPKLSEFDASESISPVRIGPVSLAAGFATISMPEINLVTEEINQCIDEPPVDIIKGATVGSISITRGVYLVDPDFFSWIRMAAQGQTYSGMFRRNLLLMWYKERIGIKNLKVPLMPQGIPFKTFFLEDAIPIRYKPGADFDASSSEISLQELELKPRNVMEIDGASLLPI